MIDGGRIVVEVADIRGDHVRIGITAPAEMPIHREEIQREIDRERKRLSR